MNTSYISATNLDTFRVVVVHKDSTTTAFGQYALVTASPSFVGLAKTAGTAGTALSVYV